MAIFDGWYNPRLMHVPVLFWIVDATMRAVVPIAIYLIGRKSGYFNNSDIGLKSVFYGNIPRYKSMLKLVGMITIAYIALYFSLGMTGILAINLFNVSSNGLWAIPILTVIPRNTILRVFGIFYISVSAGLGEEFLCRGLLLKLFNFKRQTLYVFTSSFIFALAHWEAGYAGMLGMFVFAAMSCILYLWFKTLWPSVVAHFTIVFTFMIMEWL